MYIHVYVGKYGTNVERSVQVRISYSNVIVQIKLRARTSIWTLKSFAHEAL
jgi:hypothetical protein